MLQLVPAYNKSSMEPKRLAEILAELRTGYERIYGPRLVDLVLFGSQARGDADPESDIDLIVVLNGPPRRDRERDKRISSNSISA
ncbi:MAG: nucleotidyltransferase family protein [Bryobacteraceae bacterium]